MDTTSLRIYDQPEKPTPFDLISHRVWGDRPAQPPAPDYDAMSNERRRAQDADRPGQIYFMTFGEGGPIKIGPRTRAWRYAGEKRAHQYHAGRKPDFSY